MTKLPSQLTGLRLPVIAAPLFIISNPDLVIAQCKAGIVGSFPALNAREKDGEPIELERWLKRITEGGARMLWAVGRAYALNLYFLPAQGLRIGHAKIRSDERYMYSKENSKRDNGGDYGLRTTKSNGG